MSFAVIEGGTYYHNECIAGERLRERMPPSIYIEDVQASDLQAYDALVVADRINPTALRRRRRLLLDYLVSGKTLVVMGENRAEQWAPDVVWSFRPTNFWWWLDKGIDPGIRIAAPDHPLFAFVESRDIAWHYHGLLTVPEGATSLIDILPAADEQGNGGSLLYDHAGIGEANGRLIVSTLDPFYHHGSFFMPAASRFLSGLLDWLHSEFSSRRCGAPREFVA